MTRSLLALLLISIAALAHPAELTAIVEGEYIGARLRALAFPDSLRKDLRSGLTNKLLLRVTLQEGTRTVVNANAQISLQYDLWDERFHTELSVNGTPLSTPELRTVDEAIAECSKLRQEPPR